MTKTIRAAMRKRGKAVKRRLVTIRTRIAKLINEFEDEPARTIDADCLLICLSNAHAQIVDAEEHHTTLL